MANPVYAPGIERIGTAYDIMKGNPLSTVGIDPGISKQRVFELTYVQGKTTPDSYQWSVPDHTVVDPVMSSCSASFVSRTMTGEEQYVQSLEEHVIADVIADISWDAKFAANRDYRLVSDTTKNNQTIIVQSSAQCVLYAVALYLNDAPKLDPAFLTLVAQLPTTYDEYAYTTLVDKYGTHVVTSMNLGGRFGQRSALADIGYVDLLKGNVNIEYSAALAAQVSSGDSNMTPTQKEEASQFSAKTVAGSSATFNIGGPFKADSAAWAASVMQEGPMPLRYEVQSLDRLFTTQYMPAASVAKRDNVRKILNSYCAVLMSRGLTNTCVAPEVDRPLPTMQKILYSYNTYDDATCGGAPTYSQLRGSSDCTPYPFEGYQTQATRVARCDATTVYLQDYTDKNCGTKLGEEYPYWDIIRCKQDPLHMPNYYSLVCH